MEMDEENEDVDNELSESKLPGNMNDTADYTKNEGESGEQTGDHFQEEAILDGLNENQQEDLGELQEGSFGEMNSDANESTNRAIGE